MKKSKADHLAPKGIDIVLDSTNDTISVPLMLAFKPCVKGNTPWYGKIISWWTKSPYYHVELIMFDKYWVSATANEGVYIRELEPLRDSWDYVTLKPVRLTKSHLKKIVSYINRQNGKEYDMKGIVWSQVFKFNVDSSVNWFCSELATQFLMMLGVEPFYTQAPQAYSPGDMFKELEPYINKYLAGESQDIVKEVVLNSKK